MRKLELKVESLRVESFFTRTTPAKQGTVRGHEIIDTEICNNTNNSACFTYGTACWPGCGGGDTAGCQTVGTKPSECVDCTM